MSRIRSIKPDMWTSDDFLALTIEGQLAFIWLISNADDEGRLKTNPQHISRVLGVGDIGAQLSVMVQRNMIKRYEVARFEYIELCHFREHQRVDKPRASTLPAPPNTKTSRTRRRTLQEHSKNDPGTIADDSSLARALIERTERKDLKERKDARETSVSGEADDGWEPPIQNPSIEIATVITAARARGWNATTHDEISVSRDFTRHPSRRAEDYIAEWDAVAARKPVTNPWAVAFRHSGGDADNATAVELQTRRRLEALEVARHKAVRDDERQYAAGVP